MKSKKLVKSIFANKLRVKLVVLGVFIFATVFMFGSNSTPFARAAAINTITTTLVDDGVGATSQVDVVFTPATALEVGDVITIYLGENNSGGNEWDLSAIADSDCSCSDTGGAYGDGVVTEATASMPANVQWTTATAGTSEMTCQIGDSTDPDNPATASGYSIAVVTNDDAGAGVAYIGSHNDVTVTAAVLPLLTLDLDGTDNTVCTEASGVISCAMGILTTAAVTEGYYDVNAFTNGTGLTLSINADDILDSGANDIDDIVNDGTVAAGTEGYGIEVAADAGLTKAGDFATDDTPIPTSETTFITAAAPVSTSDTTVTHKAAIASDTPVGSYAQIVTYTLAGTF